MFTTIYDLDGTVIDSSHRYRTLPDGSIDLPAWIRLATRENIMRDQLLPLADLWRSQLHTFGHRIIVCTARVFSQWDHAFLARHGLHSHVLLSRPKGCMERDHVLKAEQLTAYIDNPERTVIYDDHAGVRQTLSETFGILAIDPADVIGHNNGFSIRKFQ